MGMAGKRTILPISKAGSEVHLFRKPLSKDMK